MSDYPECEVCITHEHCEETGRCRWRQLIDAKAKERATVGVAAASTGSAIGGEFYNGMEWLAAWLVDHAEGETVTEELARQWAVEAWQEHVRRQGPNNPVSRDHSEDASR